jgi:hypothetical protein
MRTSNFIRLSGVAAILAGIFTLAGTILELNPVPSLLWVYLVLTISSITTLVGIYVYQKETAGTLGSVGFVVALTGNLLLILPNPAIGGSVYALGLLLVGVASLKAGSFPRWVPWLWIAALFIGVPGFLLPNLESLLFLSGSAVFALSFIGAGYTMWKSV